MLKGDEWYDRSEEDEEIVFRLGEELPKSPKESSSQVAIGTEDEKKPKMKGSTSESKTDYSKISEIKDNILTEVYHKRVREGEIKIRLPFSSEK